MTALLLVRQRFAHCLGLADASVSGGTLLVNGATRGAQAVLANFSDDDYMMQVTVDLNGGTDFGIFVRYVDPNNAYRVRLDSTLKLHKLEDGKDN